MLDDLGDLGAALTRATPQKLGAVRQLDAVDGRPSITQGASSQSFVASSSGGSCGVGGSGEPSLWTSRPDRA